MHSPNPAGNATWVQHGTTIYLEDPISNTQGAKMEFNISQKQIQYIQDVIAFLYILVYNQI